MPDFHKFANGTLNAGDREDDPREGAMVCFDAWGESRGWAFRVWHYNKDLEVVFEGESLNVITRVCDFHKFDDEGGEDHCTLIKFEPTGDSGWAEIKIPSELMYDRAKISWGGGFLKDMYENEAEVKIKTSAMNGSHVEVKEQLTDREERYFSLERRIEKLRGIAQKKGHILLNHNLLFSKNEILGSIDAEDYSVWLAERSDW